MSETVLSIKNLQVAYNRKSNIFSKGRAEKVIAVDDVSLDVHKNHIQGLVGESGSGKSTIAKAIMGMAPIHSGSIDFQGQPLRTNTVKIQMIFQDSNSSLNPKMTLREILSEPILINNIMTKKEIPDYLKELMNMVDLPADYLSRYPRQLSGGQRQRIGIARALTTKPKLIIADEPTSALDVSVQSQILNLLLDLKEKLDVSMIFISHNLAVVRYISDDVAVMQHGKIVESGEARQVFAHPQNPYTHQLIESIPSFNF